MSQSANRAKVPPGQQVVSSDKWPIIGERHPAPSREAWTLSLNGAMDSPKRFSLEQLLQMPQSEFTVDIHCVTRWSKLDVTFGGVLLADLLEQCAVQPSARFISFVARSERNHSTSLTLDDALTHGCFIALTHDGEPLSIEHGGPIRNIVPGKYFYKSVKWLREIELLEEDRLGFWEAESGYHNGADPWLVQRYMAPTLDRRTAAQLMKSRDFAGRDLRSINCERMELDGLRASQALLRDANFRHASLVGADFTGANLSNAHLQHAVLRDARFVGTDLEGADLSGADLRGADLTGCSLIGASFWTPGAEPGAGAWLDDSTVLPDDLLTPLTDEQSDYVKSRRLPGN